MQRVRQGGDGLARLQGGRQLAIGSAASLIQLVDGQVIKPLRHGPLITRRAEYFDLLYLEFLRIYRRALRRVLYRPCAIICVCLPNLRIYLV